MPGLRSREAPPTGSASPRRRSRPPTAGMTIPAGSARRCSSGASATPPSGGRAPPRSAEASVRVGRDRNRRCLRPEGTRPARLSPSTKRASLLRTRRNRSSTTTHPWCGARNARSRASWRTSAPAPSPRTKRRRRLRASAAFAPPSSAPPPRAATSRARPPRMSFSPRRMTWTQRLPRGPWRGSCSARARRLSARARAPRRTRATPSPEDNAPAATQLRGSPTALLTRTRFPRLCPRACAWLVATR
mmetsp:Transcript_1557/g.6269  ORF Transcript_1557/g.6269 Transcript_1557/m.6269 type:complete len:246 (-) Transcript_1557:488-1225(-)